MNIKGFDALAQHFPPLKKTKGIIGLGVMALSRFLLVTVYFVASDLIPTWTIDSSIVVMAVGFYFLSRAFTQKKTLIEKHGDKAYQAAVIRFILPGLAILLAMIVHIAYMGDVNQMKFTREPFATVMRVLGGYWVVVGFVLWLRSALTFGVDNLAWLYVYIPAEGRMVNSEIYDVLRHPVYAGIIRFGWGLALLNADIFALAFIPFLPLGFFGWIRLVEEKDLLERLPDYEEYRRRVPAFFVKPQDIGKFFKFLITGK